MTWLDVALCMSCVLCDHLCEVEPTTNALITKVIHTIVALVLALANNLINRRRQVICIGWCTHLVKDYF